MKYVITRREDLSAHDYLLEVEAPHVAERFKAGNFAVLMTVPTGERIPMSIQKAENGRITMFIRKMGKTSIELSTFRVGDCLHEVIGPMGTPVEIKSYGNVVVASDFVCGHAENYALCGELHGVDGNHITSLQTFPSRSEVYPAKERPILFSDEYRATTLDTPRGTKGHYIHLLKGMLDEGRVDIVFAGGDLAGLRDLAELTRPYGVPTVVTVRQIMVDATGMCGSCRVFVDGEMKLACIDGPMFDAHKVNFEHVLSRTRMFRDKEADALEHYCARRKAD